jgi:hypothetical protein
MLHECAVGYHAGPFVAGMRPGALRQLGAQREPEVQIQADGGRAAWRHGAETMQIVCDFSAADGFCRDAHIDIRREAH